MSYYALPYHTTHPVCIRYARNKALEKTSEFFDATRAGFWRCVQQQSARVLYAQTAADALYVQLTVADRNDDVATNRRRRVHAIFAGLEQFACANAGLHTARLTTFPQHETLPPNTQLAPRDYITLLHTIELDTGVFGPSALQLVAVRPDGTDASVLVRIATQLLMCKSYLNECPVHLAYKPKSEKSVYAVAVEYEVE